MIPGHFLETARRKGRMEVVRVVVEMESSLRHDVKSVARVRRVAVRLVRHTKSNLPRPQLLEKA